MALSSAPEAVPLSVAETARRLGCTSATLFTLDSSGNAGTFVSVTVGPDGLPLFSYYDITNTALKVVHCASPACEAYQRRR